MHNTGNPLPSLDERDLYDNILNLDKVMNSETDTWIDRFGIEKPTISAALKSAGFMPAGFDFVTGGTLQPGDRNKAVYNPAPNGDGSWYKWGGELPKTILPSSQPNPKDSANWSPISVNVDGIAREALRRTYLEVGLNLVPGSFEEGANITSTTDVVLHEKTGKCYSGPIGNVPKGTDPLSGNFVDKSGLLLSYSLTKNSIFISAFKTIYNSVHDALDAAMALSASTGVTVVSDVGFSITRPIEQPPKSKVVWTANCTISPSFSGAYIYQVDGGYAFPSYSSAHAWTLPGKTSMEGFKAYAENFEMGVNAEALVIRRAINTKVHDVVITGANLGGLRSQDGYEAEVQNINVVVSSARDVASIGCAINSSDGSFRSIVPIGYAKGGRVTGGSNYIENLHPWGNTETNAIGVMGKMHWGDRRCCWC